MSNHYLRTEFLDELHKDPELLEVIESATTDGLWIWDVRRPQEEWLSPRFKALFGYADDEVENSSDWWQANIHPDDLALALENFERHLTDPEHPYDQVVRYRHRDGHVVWVRCRGQAIRDAQGAPKLMIGAHIEVTELVGARLALEAETAKLERTNTALNEFAHRAAHDLRAPLRHVSLLASEVEADTGCVLTDGARGCLAELRERAGRTGALIDSLLQFASSGGPAGDPAPIDLPSLLDEVVTSATLPPGHRVELNCELQTVQLERAPLQQALQNLVQNASQHHDRPRARIAVAVRQGGGGAPALEVTVEDDGPGIPLDDLERLMRPFERGPRSVGSGIGLSTVRRCVDALNGRLEFAACEGRGTRATLVIPLVGPGL